LGETRYKAINMMRPPRLDDGGRSEFRYCWCWVAKYDFTIAGSSAPLIMTLKQPPSAE
jgi:hypothetical protein